MKNYLSGILSAFLLFGIPEVAFSQSSVIGFYKGQVTSRAISADNAGNTYIGGNMGKLGLVVKEDPLHNIIWKKNLAFPGAESFKVQMSTLDVLADTVFGCGYFEDINKKKGSFYFKMNATTGAVYWAKSEVAYGAHLACMRYSNGKYLLIGGFTATMDLYRAKVIGVSSATGDLIWETGSLRGKFPTLSQGFRTQFIDASQIVNGKMFITGTEESHGTPTPNISHPILIGIDENGVIFSHKYVDFGDYSIMEGQNIAFDGANNLVLTFNNSGVFNFSPPEIVYSGILKCDLSGNIDFCKYYPKSDNSQTLMQSLNVTSDSYVLMGNLFWNYDALFFLKISKSGDTLKSHDLHKPGMNYVAAYFSDMAAGSSKFINGKHYFAAAQESTNPYSLSAEQFVLDEGLESTSSCAEGVPIGLYAKDLVATMGDLVMDEVPAPIVYTDGIIITDPQPLSLCDSIKIGLSQHPICTGANLNAVISGFTAPTIKWSTGETGTSITVATTDTVTVTVTDMNCCSLIDTIVPVITGSPIVFSLPRDTIVCRQPGNSFTIPSTVSGGNGPLTYAWNDGSAQPTLTIINSGIYWLQVSDSCSSKRDSISVELRALPVISGIPLVTACENTFPVELQPTVSAGASVGWNDGVTTSDRTVNTPGVYIISAGNSCGIVSFTIVVESKPLPEVALPPLIDTCIHDRETVTLTPSTVNTDAISWSDGSSGNTLEVTNSGNYSVYGTNQCGTDTSSTLVTIHFFPELLIPAVLDTCFDEATGFSYTAAGTPGNYQWDNGSTSATTVINQVGTYTCTLSNGCGTDTKSMTVNRVTAVAIDFPQDSIFACATGIAISDLHIQSNYNLDIFYNGKLQENRVTQSGWQIIHAYNACGSSFDSIYVNLGNQQTFFLPNTFTPDGDTYNGVFRYEGENVSIRNVRIFNRWGETVYSQENDFTGWDGTFDGKPCLDGIYIVMVTYEDCFGKVAEFKGHVALLR